MRWLRLGLGLFVGYQALVLQDAFAGIIAGLFLFQAVTNTGCCGSSGCAIPAKKVEASEPEEISYEEVKPLAQGQQQNRKS